MVDQFASYAKDQEPARVRLSLDEDEADVGPPGRLRIYGEANGGKVEVVGVSYNATGGWESLTVSDHRPRLETLVDVAKDAGVPGIWIGETDGDFTDAGAGKEIGRVRRSGAFTASTRQVNVDELAAAIRDEFDSDVSPPSRAQTYTDSPVDGFQSWAQGALGLVTIDLDVVGIDSAGNVHTLTEIKRTNERRHYDMENWYPFARGKRNDKSNYLLQMDVASRIGARALVVNHPVHGFVGSDDEVYLYDFDGSAMNTVRKQGTKRTFGDSDISYDRERVTARRALDEVIDR